MLRINGLLLVLVLLVSTALNPISNAFGEAPPPSETLPASIVDAGGPNAAPQAAAWYDGLYQYSTITNCITLGQEPGIGTYVGYISDPVNNQPSPNTTYYLHLIVYGVGNPCSGTRAWLEMALPANTSLDISAANPVYCFYDGVSIAPASNCPQYLPSSPYNFGAYAIPSVDAANVNTWPVAQGHSFEFQIPVRSTTTLSNSPFHANVHAIDGYSNPWLQPGQSVYVFASLSTPTSTPTRTPTNTPTRTPTRTPTSTPTRTPTGISNPTATPTSPSGTPANNNFINAAPLPLPATASGSTINATMEVGEPVLTGTCWVIPSHQLLYSVWYRITPNASGTLTAETANPGTNFDTALALYTGSAVNALSRVGCDNNGDSENPPGSLPQWSSIMHAPVQAGQTYYLQLGGVGGAPAGNYALTVSLQAVVGTERVYVPLVLK